MNSRLCIAIGFWIAGASSFAQTSSAVPENIRAAYSIDRFSDGIINEMIYGIPLPAPKMVGDTYIDNSWMKGAFIMYGHDKPIDGLDIRYDLAKEELEIQTGEGIKLVGGNQLRSFVTIDAGGTDTCIFINSREFKSRDGIGFNGFLQVIEDGEYAVLIGYSVKVKRPDYNEAMHVGSRDYKIYKHEQPFYVVNGLLAPLPDRKRDFISIFPAQAQSPLTHFVKARKLNLSQKGDLKQIFRFYNQTLK